MNNKANEKILNNEIQEITIDDILNYERNIIIKNINLISEKLGEKNIYKKTKNPKFNERKILFFIYVIISIIFFILFLKKIIKSN